MMTILGLVFLGAVIVVGLVMAVMGASKEAFMALVLLGSGAMVVLMAVFYYKNPSYTDANGDVQPVGRGMVAMMGVLGLFLVAFGLFVQFHGLQ